MAKYYRNLKCLWICHLSDFFQFKTIWRLYMSHISFQQQCWYPSVTVPVMDLQRARNGNWSSLYNSNTQDSRGWLEVQTFPPEIQNGMKLILGKIFIGNVNNEFPILLLMAFSMWMRAAMMVLMGMVTKRFLQLRPLQELHNLEARAIQSIC